MMTNASYVSPKLYIDGEWISETAQSISIFNPATGLEIGQLPCADEALVDRALAAAEKGFKVWSAMTLGARSAIMKKAAANLRARAEEAATILTMEMGKPLNEARTEIENCAILLEWCPDNAAHIRDRVLPERDGWRDLRVRREPIGPVGAFSPWNFPASLAARKVASALAVGCSVIVRPPSETPAAFGMVAQALDAAGLPAGVLNVLYGSPDVTTYRVIDSDVVRKIAFTGSTSVGCLLAARAGAKAKPSVMELGGHAPVIVCEDVDVGKVAAMSVAAKFRNSGQICVSPTRFFVQDAVYDEFTDAFVKGAKALRVGDGLDADTQMGPLANARRVDAVHALIEDAIKRGAKLLAGGNRMNREGNFYMPTVLGEVPLDAEIMTEEPFGPVAIVNRFSDLESALAVANSTSYALGAYGFSGSDETVEKLAKGLDAGMIALNSFSLMTVDSPISGRRFSGYGAEGGPEGLEAYTMSKFSSLIAS
jgi:succinate-semialdehyde dehydrogenase/glutarate-semialdehyde dehydrogenase